MTRPTTEHKYSVILSEDWFGAAEQSESKDLVFSTGNWQLITGFNGY